MSVQITLGNALVVATTITGAYFGANVGRKLCHVGPATELEATIGGVVGAFAGFGVGVAVKSIVQLLIQK